MANTMQRRIGVALIAVAVAMLTGLPAAQAQQEDVLSAKQRSAPALLSEGYQVVAYEVVDDRESRLILRKRYNLALCILDESRPDEEELEVESMCYRLR